MDFYRDPNNKSALEEATATIDGHRQAGQLFAGQSSLSLIARRVVLQSPLEPWLFNPKQFTLLQVLLDNLDVLVAEDKKGEGFIEVKDIDLSFYSNFFEQPISHAQLLSTQQALMLKSRVLGFAAPNKDSFLDVLLTGQLQPYHFRHEKIQAIRTLVKQYRAAVKKRLPSGPLAFLW